MVTIWVDHNLGDLPEEKCKIIDGINLSLGFLPSKKMIDLPEEKHRVETDMPNVVEMQRQSQGFEGQQNQRWAIYGSKLSILGAYEVSHACTQTVQRITRLPAKRGEVMASFCASCKRHTAACQ